MKLIKFSFLLIFMCASAPIFATSNIEGERVGEEVAYADGSKAKIICAKSDECEIEVVIGKETYKIDRKTLKNSVYIKPGQLALVHSGSKATVNSFTVYFEIACDQYAENPPVYMCLAWADMKGGELKGLTKYRHVYEEVDMQLVEGR